MPSSETLQEKDQEKPAGRVTYQDKGSLAQESAPLGGWRTAGLLSGQVSCGQMAGL